MYMIQFTGHLTVPRLTLRTNYDCGQTLPEVVAYGQSIAAMFAPGTYSRMAVFETETECVAYFELEIATITKWKVIK